MRVITQALGELLDSLRPLTVEWQDDVARRVIARLRELPIKPVYTEADVRDILENGKPAGRLTGAAFEEGLLIIRLFLGLSKDQFTGVLIDALGPGGARLNRYRRDPAEFVSRLLDIGLLDGMAAEVNCEMHWSDTLASGCAAGGEVRFPDRSAGGGRRISSRW